jgi:hypothetical protein
MPNINFVKVSTALVSTPAGPANYLAKAGYVPPIGQPPFAEAAKEYSSAQALLDDGFSSSDSSYLAALQYFGQGAFNGGVSPTRFVVVNRGAATAQVATFEVVASDDGDYKLFIADIGGSAVEAATFTAAGNTEAQIRDGLVASFNGGAFAATQTAAPGAGNTGTITADVAGVPFVLTGTGPNGAIDITITETTANVGVYEDLDAAFAAVQFWDVVPDPAYDDGTKIECTRWAEAAEQLTVDRRNVCSPQTADTDIVAGTPGNFAERLEGLGRTRTFGVVHVNTTDQMTSAWDGRYLAFPAGSRAYHFGRLGGSSVADSTIVYTEAQGEVFRAAKISWVEREYADLSSPLRIQWGQGSGGFFKVQKAAEDRWWFEVRAAVIGELESLAGVNLDEDGIRQVIARIDDINVALANDGVIDLSRTSISFVPPEDVPADEAELGKYVAPNGGIVVNTVLIPKIRELGVTGIFALS